jgi:uncharacterized glyoxalase superfamily protein PhnB
MHAQLTFGDGMVMLGTAQPGADGGDAKQMVCVVVPDADLVYSRAKATGAEITTEIHDQPYGGRGFGCTDPEGHHWYIGSYDPWTTPQGGEGA